MADAFSRFYAAFNVEWPQYGMTPEEATIQERRWRQAIGDFSTDALSHAMTELVRTAKKRPKPADVVEHAQAYSRGKVGLRPVTRIPDHLCPCGCGGTKWLKVLRDDHGNVRHFAADPTVYLANLGVRLTPYQQGLFREWQGQPLTRVKQQCHRIKADPLPDLAYRIGMEGELPVYDLRGHNG